jgi:hypothetical protein
VLLALLLVVGTAGAVAADTDRATALHLLQRLTYGPRPGDVERVQALGERAWLEGQLDPTHLDDTAVERALAPCAR